MADFKVITRGEVNELVPGTFTDDLNKAVLYGELSGNPAFIVNSVNQASGLNYREDQALLGADIQVRSGASILLTIGVNPVLATATTNTFTIVVDNIDVSTLGWYQVGSVGVTTCTVDNNNLSGTTNFPENEEYTAKTITVAVSGTSLTGDMVTGVTSFIQGRAEVTPELSIIYNGSDVPASSGETSSFTITKDYVTINEIEVDGDARVVSSGDTGVTIEYPANTGDSRDFTVTVYGTDVYGSSHTATCTFTQEGDDYVFRLNPSSAAPAATSTSTTTSIISQNVDSIGVSGYAGGVSGARITGNTLIVEFPANQDTQEKEMTVTLTGVTTGGRVVPIIFPITQGAAGQIVFSLTYNGGTVDSSSGTTSDFTIGIAEATITRFTVPAGCSYTTGGTSDNPTLIFNYPANTDENNSKTYTITMEGTNTFGEYVSASTEVTQSADSYVFSLSPVSNPIAASASTAAFNLASTSVSGIGYYPAQSQNINGISGLSTNSVTATGITPNSGSTDKDIVLVLSGKTNAGRTVYATGTTLQVHSRSGFGFEGGFDVNPGATSTTVEYTYKYLTGSTLTLYASDGAYFDSTHTITSTTVNVTPNSAERTESVNVFFDANKGSVKTYTISNVAVIGEAGESFTDNVVITHKAERKITVTPTSGTTSESAGTVTFTVTWENFKRSDLINLSPTNVTISSSAIVLTSESGTTAITATKTANTGTTTRDLTLIASYGSGSEQISDTGLIVQNVPRGTVTVRVKPAERDVPSDSGSRIFYVDWTYLKPGAKITFISNNITNYTPTSITITESNYNYGDDNEITAYYTANPGTSERFLELTGTSIDLRNENRKDYTFYRQAGTVIHNPDIWWTKTSGGAKNTEVTRITDVPAFVPNTYDGGNVTYTIYINYTDVSTVSMDPSGLKNGASATIDGKTVTITAPANSGSTSCDLGYITVTGTAPDGRTTDTARLDVDQVGGVSTSLLIEGKSIYTASTISYSGGQATYNYTSSNVGNIGTGATSGAATESSLNSSNKTLTVRFSENTSATSRSWEAPITGKTVFGNVVTAKAVGTQEAAPGYNPDIWWTKTSGGTVKVTATTVSAYTPNSYTTAATVQHKIYINYNSDVVSGTVSMDITHLTNGASATIDGKTVTITASTNSGDTLNLGTLVISGKAPDGTPASATLIITQAAGTGISPYLYIEGASSYTDNENISYSGGQRTHNFSYEYVGEIGTSGLTNASGSTADTNNHVLTVGVIGNTGSVRQWGTTVTGITVFGNIIKATIIGTQDAGPNTLYLNSLGLYIDNTHGAPDLVITVDFNLNIGRTYSTSHPVSVGQGKSITVSDVVDSNGNYTFTSSEVNLAVTSFTLTLKTKVTNYIIRAKFPGGSSDGIGLLTDDSRTFTWSAGGNPHSLGTFTPSRNSYPESTGADNLQIIITQGVQ